MGNLRSYPLLADLAQGMSARVLQLTRERVRQIEDEALAKLRKTDLRCEVDREDVA
jgi:hypothetical protein